MVMVRGEKVLLAESLARLPDARAIREQAVPGRVRRAKKGDNEVALTVRATSRELAHEY
jgi:hypothetical protein